MILIFNVEMQFSEVNSAMRQRKTVFFANSFALSLKILSAVVITLNILYLKTDSLSSCIPPKVGVILLPYGNSVIETLRFQWYFIRP